MSSQSAINMMIREYGELGIFCDINRGSRSQERFYMGWSEFVIIMLLIVAMIAAILFWQMRSYGYAAIFGLLFVVGVYAMMQGPIGEQIRKEMQEDKAAASQVKRTG